MGKKHKKEIRKAFAGWDDISPEEQMRNADEFYNINKDNAEDILDLGVSDKVLVDTETGLEKDIVDNIVDNFKEDEVLFDDTESEGSDEVIDNFFDNLEKEFSAEEPAAEEEEEVSSDTTEDASEETEDPKEESTDNTVIEEDSADADVHEEVKEEPKEDTNEGEEDAEVSNEEAPVEEDPVPAIEPEEDFSDVRKFGCSVRKKLGIVTFNDGLSAFTLNEHQAMLENYGDNVEKDTITPAIIELFKTALICNRYPAAIYTKDEFVSMDVLGNGKFKQDENEHAVFVDVLNNYIAVYFVYFRSIDRFDSTIRSIIPDAGDDFADPYNNVWIGLASILDSDHHSFDDDENFVEYFYNSEYNEKELVAKYLKSKYIEPGDEPCSVDIIGRDIVVSRFDYVMGEIFDVDDLDEAYEENEEDEKVTIGTEEDIMKALDDTEPVTEEKPASSDNGIADTDGSMVIPVFHKEGKK